ncbi:MAG: 30S ribosome-binding factor RbfA [Bacilli bacterium]|nr:30S ribosome-binding factor RbfA [Bacilli bacterium]
MSIKINRIESMLLREISYILANEVKDNDIKFVTVTAVNVTNDLSFAKVYVTVLADDKKESTMKALKDASGFIRSELYDRVDIRHIPELTFVYDESIEYGKKIENIIEEIKKQEN